MELLIDIGICLLHRPQEPFFKLKKSSQPLILFRITSVTKRPRIPQSGCDGLEMDPVEIL